MVSIGPFQIIFSTEFWRVAPFRDVKMCLAPYKTTFFFQTPSQMFRRSNDADSANTSKLTYAAIFVQGVEVRACGS